MEAFSRGWAFLKQAWQMAFKDKDLLKPSIYALVVGGIISVIGIIPIILVAMLTGGSDVGNVITVRAGRHPDLCSIHRQLYFLCDDRLPDLRLSLRRGWPHGQGLGDREA